MKQGKKGMFFYKQRGNLERVERSTCKMQKVTDFSYKINKAFNAQKIKRKNCII